MLRVRRVHARHVHEIGDHRACRRLGTRPGPVIQRRPHGVTLDEHGVHHAFDVGNEPLRWNERRMDAELDPCLRTPRNAEELDAVSELFRVTDVLARQLRDALGIDLVELHRHAERDRRHDGQLVRGVDALDVVGRIGLGVTARLRFLQHGAERSARCAHFGQDEVGRAVDDPGDPLDPIGGQSFPQRLDDRDAAGDCTLERDHYALRVRSREDLVAVLREQRLVRGHHVLAVRDRLQDERSRMPGAADQLDNDVDVGASEHDCSVVRHIDAGRPAGQFARPLDRPLGNPRDPDLSSRAPRDLLFVSSQHGPKAGAHRAYAKQADLQRFHRAVTRSTVAQRSVLRRRILPHQPVVPPRLRHHRRGTSA